MKIELFPLANSKHNLFAVFWVYRLGTLTSNSVFLNITSCSFVEMLYHRITRISMKPFITAVLWTVRSSSWKQISSVVTYTFLHMKLFIFNPALQLTWCYCLSLNLFGVPSITQWVISPLHYFEYHSASYHGTPVLSSRLWYTPRSSYTGLSCSQLFTTNVNH